MAAVYTFSSILNVIHRPSYPSHAGTSCITLCATIALITGVVAFSSGIMFAAVCNILYTQQWKVSRKKHKDSNHTVATFPQSQQQQQDESPEYEEIPMAQSGFSDIMELQQNTAYAQSQGVNSYTS